MLLGMQRDHAEATHSSYKVVLAFLKATHHLFLEAGMEKRQGFDLFRPNQSIILSMPNYREAKLGASVRLWSPLQWRYVRHADVVFLLLTLSYV